MQATEQMSELVVLKCVTDKARSCIEKGLEPVQQVVKKADSVSLP